MKFSIRGRDLVQTALAVGFLGVSGIAAAYDYQSDDGDLTLKWGNTFRYNLGWRAQSRNSVIASEASTGQSDLKFDRGDVVTNRIDVLSELNVTYKQNYGFRVSASGWWDSAYSNHSVPTPSGAACLGQCAGSYTNANNSYSPLVARYYNGPSGEFLDAFVFARLDVADVPVDVRVGRLTNYWGESLFAGNASVAYSQSPTDGRKALASPGIEIKEVFLPIGQILVKAQVASNLSLTGEYFYEWLPNRLPGAGVFVGPSDSIPQGIDRIPLPAAFGLNIPITDPLVPKKYGNFGLSARYDSEPLGGTIGLYYRKFDDYDGWVQQVPGAGGSPIPAGLRYVYPKDIELYGVSMSTKGPWGGSIGAELSYRRNDALQTSILTAALSPDNEGPRGDTWHALVNAIWLLPTTPLWETGSLAAEIGYSRLDKLTAHPELFYGEGYGDCKANNLTKSNGCSTRDVWMLGFAFDPQWMNVWPSWDIDLPIHATYGLKGNGAGVSSLANEDAYSYSAGINFKYRQNTDFTLAYNGYYAKVNYDLPAGLGSARANGAYGLNDKAFVSLTVKTSF